jgi:hypothetical protein
MSGATIDHLVDPITLKIAQLSTMRATAVCVRSLIANGMVDDALKILDVQIASCTERLEDLGVTDEETTE